MLRRELVDLVNRRDVWGLVGSGPSIDAGGPSWGQLVDAVVEDIASRAGDVSTDSRLRKAIERKDFPVAFSRLVDLSDRDAVEAVVRDRTLRIPAGEVARAIADWPLAGLITTNYDPALTNALEANTSEGWVAVGNTSAELAKITGNAERVVWHVHGAAALPDRSHLVLTQEDYDALYLHQSEVIDALAGLLQHKRVVVVGFGFNDPDVMRLLRKVGSTTSPERPIFAFVGGLDGRTNEADRQELLFRYNVDVLPYRVHDGSHAELRQLVNVYGSLMVRRSLRLNQPPRHTPEWDAETTALLTYNELVLKHSADVPEAVLSRLLRARIIARLKYNAQLTRQDIVDELAERARLLGGGQTGIAADEGTAAVDQAIDALQNDGLISATEDRLELTKAGEELVVTQAGRAELLREQFTASLRTRSREAGAHPSAIEVVSGVLAAYFEECMQRRGLGVALAWQSATREGRRFHVTALLQHLPEFLEQLSQPAEVELAVKVVEDVLAAPTDSERIYLGLRTQAQFSVQLLAYSPDLVAARVHEMAETVFVLDSNILIPLLAEGAPGHGAAKKLVAEALRAGATVVTTEDLVQEVRDHARWAKQLLEKSPQSVEVVQAATGGAGFRENLFLAGFLNEAADAGGSLDFDQYIDRLCASRNAHRGHLDAFNRAFEDRQVPVRSITRWDGFDPLMWVDKDDAKDEIETERRRRDTYRGDLQVQAEAEARILVERARSGEIGLAGRRFAEAFFISNSRVVDFVGGFGERVTMRAESALQWLSTLSGADPDQLACLTDGLQWELADAGLAVVDRSKLLRVFAPIIDASSANLEDQLAEYRILSAEEYGEDPAHAFVDPLDIPRIERSHLVQKAAAAEAERDAERAAKLAAQQTAKLTQRDQDALEKFRQKAAAKKRKAKQKSRRNQSSPKKKRRK